MRIAEDKIRFFNDLYQHAKDHSKDQHDRMDKWLAQYNGDARIDDANGNPMESNRAKVVRNITYELIESQVSSYIPTAKVTPGMYSTVTDREAKSIEKMLASKRDKLPFEQMNDLDERYTPIRGGSVWLVEWDETIRTHNTSGDVRVTVLDPIHFVGQPYIYDVQEMEYCFLVFKTTKEDVARKYGVTIEKAEEAAQANQEDDNDETVELVTCYYKDEQDKVCKYTFVDLIEIEDIQDYYARKTKRCRKCGEKEGLCHCEKPKWETVSEEYETVQEEGIAIRDGTDVIPGQVQAYKDGQPMTEEAEVPMTDAMGNIVMQDGGLMLPVMIKMQVPKMERTKLPFYRPSLLPVAIRRNTSEKDNLYGQSDCAAIRKQQQEINKIESRISDKLLKSAVIGFVPDDVKVPSLDAGVYNNIIRIEEKHRNLFGSVDLTPDISRDQMQSDRLYDQAKRILGISDSFQGQHDASAQSGVAKQLQINQSAGRLESKRKMKNAAYADIDHIIFQYMLAYADEPRPASFRDENGHAQNIIFNRYDFIERDEAGEFYYNDDFLFSADNSVEAEGDRNTMWELNLQNLSNGTFGNPADPNTLLHYWLAQERAHYPHARENVEYLETMVQQMQEQAAMAAQIQRNAAMQMPQGGGMTNGEPV